MDVFKWPGTNILSSFQEVDGIKVLQLETAAGAAIRVNIILDFVCFMSR